MQESSMAGSDRLMDCQTEAFPLEGKVANEMSRMRCSRRSGVTFLAMITAIAWPTPHHRLRRSLSSRRSLLVDALANWHQSLRSVSALNFHLRGSRQRSWMPGLAKPDRRGNIQGNGWRLRRSGHAEFSRPRVWPVIPFNFYSIDFHVTRSLL